MISFSEMPLSSCTSTGSFWYSARKLTSSRIRRFIACWIADTSDGVLRDSHAARKPRSIFSRFAK